MNTTESCNCDPLLGYTYSYVMLCLSSKTSICYSCCIDSKQGVWLFVHVRTASSTDTRRNVKTIWSLIYIITISYYFNTKRFIVIVVAWHSVCSHLGN